MRPGQQGRKRRAALEAETRSLRKELRSTSARIGRASKRASEAEGLRLLADLQEQSARLERRQSEVRAELDALRTEIVAEADVRDALEQFDAVWDLLTPKEQARAIELLVERVAYDGAEGTVALTFRPNGISELLAATASEERAS